MQSKKQGPYVFARAKNMIVVILILAMAIAGLSAQNTMSGNVKLIGAYPLEAKLEGGYSVKIPFLQGQGALFNGNNITLKSLLGVSPVAATLSADAVLTPIAVMELNLGGAIGTGWDFAPMDLSGLNLSSSPGLDVTSDSLGGAYYMGWAGGALQFDTAAIFPGDWTSVVMRTYHEISYQGYSNAGAEQGWEYELGGLRVNGLNYKGEYLVGYHMPLILNLVGIQVETFLHNIDTDSATPLTMDLSLVTNFAFTDRLTLMVVPQLTTRYVDEDTRVVTSGDVTYKRIVVMLNCTF